MMRSITEKFTEHPASVGETYFEHLRSASSFSGRMALGAIACFLHGVFPFLCQKTGSRQICELHDRMVANRSKLTPEEAAAPAATPAMAQAAASHQTA